MSRQHDLDRFYEITSGLKNRVGGCRRLCECTGKSGWPQRGVYFFFEDGEFRADGVTPRVVRVGTHAVSTGSRTTLWNRLRTHRGHGDGSGNHRGSIFRLRVGQALLTTKPYPITIVQTWGRGGTAPRDVRLAETPLEKDVSNYIGQMPFLWIELDDEPSAESKRAYLERNSIALLSNFGRPVIDPPSRHWLGKHSPEPTIRESGLWNTNHVTESYDPAFLDFFALIVRTDVRDTQHREFVKL